MSSLLERRAATVLSAAPAGRFRFLRDLVWAERCKSPFGATASRGCSPATRAGLVYERKVLGALRAASEESFFLPNLWYMFEDAEGEGFASPDVWCPQLNLVIEVKLSLTKEAFWQLEKYKALISAAEGVAKPRGLVVCKNWRDLGPTPVGTVAGALKAPADSVLLWG